MGLGKRVTLSEPLHNRHDNNCALVASQAGLRDTESPSKLHMAVHLAIRPLASAGQPALGTAKGSQLLRASPHMSDAKDEVKQPEFETPSSQGIWGTPGVCGQSVLWAVASCTYLKLFDTGAGIIGEALSV